MIFKRKSEKEKPGVNDATAGVEGASHAVIQQFADQLASHEDLLFGVALFFEGLNILYEGHDETIASYRKQFRNIMQHGKEVALQAMKLLEDAKNDPASLNSLGAFRFTLGEGHEQPEEFVKRAEVLVETYKRIFPDRSRETPFSYEETMRLIEEAAESF